MSNRIRDSPTEVNTVVYYLCSLVWSFLLLKHSLLFRCSTGLFSTFNSVEYMG